MLIEPRSSELAYVEVETLALPLQHPAVGHDRHAAGDHVITVGEVLAMSAAQDGAPLVYFRGGYRRLAGAG